MLSGAKPVGVEVALYYMENYLLNDKVGRLEKRLFNWWLDEGFFLVSNFKKTDTGISGEFILLLGGSIYDVTRTLDEPQEKTAAIKDSVQKKLDDGWDLILKVKPNYYLVKDTENNRGRIEKLFKNNIRNFDFVEYKTKQEGDIKILKSIIINVHRKKVNG